MLLQQVTTNCEVAATRHNVSRADIDQWKLLLQADKIATGHNADDIAETVLLNIVRGDLPRLSRCAAIVTGEDAFVTLASNVTVSIRNEQPRSNTRLCMAARGCAYSDWANL